jgi:hypothetical protein
MNNHTLRRLGGFCFAAFLAVSSAFAFEGKVDMKMTSGSNGKDAMEMSYRIKGDKMRIEIPADSSNKKKKSRGDDSLGAVIIDGTKKEMTILMTEQKMYMVRAIPEPKEPKKKSSDVDFKATGRKEKIAGIEAEEYVGVSGGKINEVWVTKELGKFIGQQSGPRGKQPSAWEVFAQKGDMFPLRTIQRSKADGPEEFRMEVTNVDRSKQDASLFAPPADYTKFAMGEMMKGMIPGR